MRNKNSIGRRTFIRMNAVATGAMMLSGLFKLRAEGIGSKVIDCHHHLDPSMVTVDGLIKSMDAFGIDKVALIAKLNPPIYMSKALQSSAPLLNSFLYRKEGVLHNVALSTYRKSFIDGKSVNLFGKTIEVYPQPDNNIVMDTVASHPDRFVSWVFVNPTGPVRPVDEIKRCQAKGKIIGVKAHPAFHAYPISLLKETGEFCQEAGLPMLIHLGADDGGDFKLLPKSFPRLKIIYAHAGVPYGPEVRELVTTRDNVFVDFSSHLLVNARIAKDYIKHAGPGKCLCGSDGPYYISKDDRVDYGPSIEIINQLNLSSSDRERLTGRNFQEIIGK